MPNTTTRTLRCVHFTGTVNERCNAGVAYKSVAVSPNEHPTPSAARLGHALPCFSDGAGHCESCRFPTPEEVAAREKEMAEYFAQTMEARTRIRTAAGYSGTKPTRDLRGSIECPRCKGTLGYSVSSYNGHIWGRCSTSGCLAWME